MKEQKNIPSGRLARTGKFVGTGARIGVNYLKYYGKRAVTGDEDRGDLHENNARDVYESLSNLKGSALKVAQMLSMDQGLLPEAYSQKFSQAQYSAPPLSYPLVVQTFRKLLRKTPLDIFDTFEKNAFAAASIGQVHRATKDGKTLAVKIQYPGVANSIQSDLKMVRPVVGAMFNISQAEMQHYLSEVEERLLEETDYELELKRSREISEQCSHIADLYFPKYYPEYSGARILTMDWLDGRHMKEFLQTNPSQEVRNRIGQAIWDFYDFQIHQLKSVHADPHPGNFLLHEDGTVGVLDFGCVKEFPQEFYDQYFQLMEPAIEENDERFSELLYELQFLLPGDNSEEVSHFKDLYKEILQLLGKPFFQDTFDFADEQYFKEIYAYSDLYQKDSLVKNAKAGRGPKDAIYLNRTYFGLYSLLNQLGAKVNTRSAVGKLFA